MEQALISRKRILQQLHEAIPVIPVHFSETSLNCTS